MRQQQKKARNYFLLHHQLFLFPVVPFSLPKPRTFIHIIICGVAGCGGDGTGSVGLNQEEVCHAYWITKKLSAED